MTFGERNGFESHMEQQLLGINTRLRREHFKAISNGNVVYDVVDSYKTLLERVMK